jgi:hypothetical protein
MSIPNPPAAAAIRVWVNSQEVTDTTSTDSDSLTIPLESSEDLATKTNAFLIEAQLEYSERPRIGKIKTTIPELEIDLADCSNWVWQLTLPPNEHLISSSDDLVLSQPWTWRKWFLSRTADPQAVLENWTGATNLLSTPSGNDYVFRSLAPKRVVEVRTAARRIIVAVASGSALVFGLMLIYLSELRQPIVLFIAAMTLATLGLMFPGPAVLMAQASAVGVVLALIGQWTAVLIHRLSLGRQLLQLPTQSRRDSSSKFQHSWSDGKSQAVTASLAAPEEPIVAADSNA